MSDRQREILREATELIATLGYDALTMRAVARASGMKLGALQYHFATSDLLLRGIAAFVAEIYRTGFAAFRTQLPDQCDVVDLVRFLVEDTPGHGLDADRLFPQLWAMSLVEPVIEELMDDLYDEFLGELVGVLSELDVEHPIAEAVVIMSMVDGLTLFVGPGRRWERHHDTAGEVILDLIGRRYGPTPTKGT